MMPIKLAPHLAALVAALLVLPACANLGTPGPPNPWNGGDSENAAGDPFVGDNSAAGANRLGSEPGGFDGGLGSGGVTGWRIEGSGRVIPQLPASGSGGTWRGGNIANDR